MIKLLIPFAYLKFVIHIIRLGLITSRAKGFEVERDWLSAWCNSQDEDLIIDRNPK